MAALFEVQARHLIGAGMDDFNCLLHPILIYVPVATAIAMEGKRAVTRDGGGPLLEPVGAF